MSSPRDWYLDADRKEFIDAYERIFEHIEVTEHELQCLERGVPLPLDRQYTVIWEVVRRAREWDQCKNT